MKHTTLFMLSSFVLLLSFGLTRGLTYVKRHSYTCVEKHCPCNGKGVDCETGEIYGAWGGFEGREEREGAVELVGATKREVAGTVGRTPDENTVATTAGSWKQGRRSESLRSRCCQQLGIKIRLEGQSASHHSPSGFFDTVLCIGDGSGIREAPSLAESF